MVTTAWLGFHSPVEAITCAAVVSPRPVHAIAYTVYAFTPGRQAIAYAEDVTTFAVLGYPYCALVTPRTVHTCTSAVLGKATGQQVFPSRVFGFAVMRNLLMSPPAVCPGFAINALLNPIEYDVITANSAIIKLHIYLSFNGKLNQRQRKN